MSNKINTIVENDGFVSRLVDVCKTDEPAELSRMLGISYQGAKNYLEGRLPDAKVLITIVEKTQCSLNWLLTGNGEKFIEKPELNFEELLDKKIENIVKKVILRGAIVVRNTSDKSVEYEVNNGEFKELSKEILAGVAERIREAVEISNKQYKNDFFKHHSYILKVVEEMENGVIPEEPDIPFWFWRIVESLRDATRHKIDWLLNNNGARAYVSQEDYLTRFSDEEKQRQIAEDFISRVKQIKKDDEKRAQVLQIRRIVQEEMGRHDGLNNLKNGVESVEQIRVRHLGLVGAGQKE